MNIKKMVVNLGALAGRNVHKPLYYKVSAKSKSLLMALFRSLFLAGVCFIILYPVILMVSRSVMSLDDMFDNSVILFPKRFSMDNFKFAFEQMNYPVAFGNTFLLSLLVTVLQTLSCMLAGYGFARFAFPGRKIFFGLVIFTLIVPPQLTMISSFLHFQFFDIFGIFNAVTGQRLNLLGSFTPFAMLGATGMGLKNGLYIFLFRQYFKNMPKETEESALADGAGPVRTFFSIMMPGAATAITTVSLFSFVWQYNDVTYASIFLGNTLTLAGSYASLGSFSGQQLQASGGADYINPYTIAAVKSTGVLLMMVPLILLYCFLQKYFVDSIERTGLVG